MAKSNDHSASTAETIIGSGVKLKGNLSSEGDIVVDGTLQGSIKTKGNLTIGSRAHITGDVGAQNVTVAGRIEGNIKASDQTTIAASGAVVGDVATGLIAISTGARISGTITMSQLTQNSSPDAKASEPVAKRLV